MSSPTAVAHEEFVDSAGHPETRGIELVLPSERHGRARDLFSVWAAPNVSVLNFTIGASMVLLGLELWQAILVILVGCLPWILTGIVAISGPAAGTSGSVITRAMYGVIGNKAVVAFTGWLISAVYLALNWLASSFMGAGLLAEWGFDDPVWGPILVTIVVSAVTVLVAVYGHGLILRVYPYVTAALAIVFLIVTAFILPNVDWSFSQPEPLEGVQLFAAMTIGFTILSATPLSYANSPDLARYLPESTKPSHIIAATALGGALPSFVFTSIGALLATAVTSEAMDAGIDSALLDMLPAWLGPIFVVGVIVNTIALNGMTTYTSSMALQAIGIPLKRIPSAITVGVIGTALTIYLVLSTSLLDAVNLMLQFLLIVSSPVMAIYVADIAMRRNRYSGADLFDEERGGAFWYVGGWNPAGMLAIVVGGTVTALCLDTEVYTGPLSALLGGADLSVPLGGLSAAGTYLLLSRRTVSGTTAGRRLGAGEPLDANGARA